MIMITIFFLVLMALLLLIFKKYRLALQSLLLSITAMLAIGSGLIPDFFLRGLQSHRFLENPEWKKNNKIVLLGGGAVQRPGDPASTQSFAYARIYEAARLYTHCKKKALQCSLLISGGDVAGLNISEATILQTELSALGIPESDIMTETKSRNTFENALYSSRILLKDKPDFTVLVTSATHMSRALMLFAHHGIEAAAAPADHLVVSYNWKHLYTNFFIADLTLHELLGQLRFIVSK